MAEVEVVIAAGGVVVVVVGGVALVGVGEVVVVAGSRAAHESLKALPRL